MRLVFLSDTHNQLDRISVPDGDVVVHCGDATNLGKLDEVARFARIFGALPHKHKLLIAGNHDWMAQKDSALWGTLMRERGITYLEDSGAVIDPDGHTYRWDTDKSVVGIKVWGSPYQPEFCNWAFNLSRYDGSLAEKWSMIPEGTDVLITHGPPANILDLAYDRHVGCSDLLDRVLKIKPKIHAFGHIHYSYGEKIFEGTHFINAAICNEQYDPVHDPIVVDL